MISAKRRQEYREWIARCDGISIEEQAWRADDRRIRQLLWRKRR